MTRAVRGRGATAEAIAEHNEEALRSEGLASVRKAWLKLLRSAPDA
jgi:hypothetical protein